MFNEFEVKCRKYGEFFIGCGNILALGFILRISDELSDVSPDVSPEEAIIRFDSCLTGAFWDKRPFSDYLEHMNMFVEEVNQMLELVASQVESRGGTVQRIKKIKFRTSIVSSKGLDEIRRICDKVNLTLIGEGSSIIDLIAKGLVDALGKLFQSELESKFHKVVVSALDGLTELLGARETGQKENPELE